MKLKRFITEEEKNKLNNIINNKNLINNNSYGFINKENLNSKDLEDFNYIENLFTEIIEGFYFFQAIVDPNKFRFIYNWNYDSKSGGSFSGTGYISILELEKGFRDNMRIIEKAIYKFSELKPEIQQKVIDKYYEKEDYPFLKDDIFSELSEIDKNKIFEDVKLEYSLSYSQGDGLCFSSDINLMNFLNNIYSKKLPEFKKSALKDYVYHLHTKNTNSYYSYCSKNHVQFDYNYSKEYIYIEKLWQNVFDEIKEYYSNICGKLEKYGYDNIEYRMSISEFTELSEDNDWEYYENGKLFF